MTVIVGTAAFLVVGAVLFFRPRLLADAPTVALAAVAGASALAAALAPGDPTGNAGVDVVLRALLGAAAAWGASASTFAAAWVVVAAALGLLVARVDGAPAAGAAAGAFAAPLAAGVRAPVVNAVVGGLAVQALLRMDWPVLTGASLVLGTVGVLPAVLVAARRLPPRVRRPAWVVTAAAAAICIAGGATGAVAAATVAGDVETAIEHAERGLDLVGDDADGARRELLEAADGFGVAEERFDAWWVLPSRVVPFVAQQSRAVATMASAGGALARTAADAVTEADVDAIRPVDGAIDLAAVEAVRGPLDRTDRALRDAVHDLGAVASPWLLPPVADRLDSLFERVADAAGSASVANDAIAVLPDLLGADGPRRYLILVQQPAEARGSGGFPGNFAVLSADDGQLDLVRSGRVSDVQTPDRFERTLTAGDEVLGPWDELVDLAGFFENTTVPPDFASAAEVARQVYEQSPGGEAVDGVIGIDPIGFAALLAITGPVDLADGTRLDESNAATFLLHGQYLGFEDAENQERIDLLGEITDVTWERISSGELPGPRAIADALGPAVDGRHLQLASFDPEEEALFQRIGAAGVLPAVDDRSIGAGVVTQNMAGNKIDFFLRREVVVDVEWDPAEGTVEGELVVTLTNDAPAEGLPRSVIGWGGPNPERTAFGENLSLVTLYTDEPVGDLDVDGGPVEDRRDGVDHGWATTTFSVRIPAGRSVTIRAPLRASVSVDALNLTPIVQASVDDPPLDLRVRTPDGWQLAEPVTTSTGARRVVSVDAERDGSALLDELRGDDGPR